MPIDLDRIISYYKNLINSRLETFFNKKIEEGSKISNDIREIIINAKEYTMRGGKRLRPIFLIYGYKCLTDININAIIDVSISVELMQSYLLIHDDIIDEDELRRGKPTFHTIYKNMCEHKFGKNKSSRFGENIAILTGDLLEAYGEEILANAPFRSERIKKALIKYAEIVKNVNYGQILDVISEMKKKVTEEDILLIHKLKTASYTIEGPLHIGAILGGANDADLQVLSRYAIPLGLAFQIRDDILGLFGSEEKIGKPVGSDLREGKKTLLVLYALKRAEEEEKRYINQALEKDEITMEEINHIRDIVIKTGSLDHSLKLIKKYTREAIENIKNSDFRDEAKEFLIAVADYIGKREY